MSKEDEALDKMAENARELGLDYEPAQQEPEPMALEKTVCPFCSSEWVTAEQHDRKMDRLEQKPVAWWNKTKDTASTDPVHRNNADCQPLYTKEQL